MTEDWMSTLKADPTGWLLKPENPSVRYFTLMNLLGYSKGDLIVEQTKEVIGQSKKIAQIFKHQRSEGYWQSAEQPYLPKYKSTYWQIIILGQLGLDRNDARVDRACQYIFNFQLEDGGFTTFGKEGAKRKYIWSKEMMLKKGKGISDFEDWTKNRIKENEMSCLTGNTVAALLKLGYSDDKRVHKALGWLKSIQNRDGGWLCPYLKSHLKDHHGCFMGTICSMDAFSLVPPGLPTVEIRRAIRRGAEFLLRHRLFKADHHNYQIINDSWLKLSFPCFFYDVLRGLDVLTRLGYIRDERINDAVEIVLRKQNIEGRWLLESAPNGRMQTDLEQVGRPSKWITLRVLQVLKRILSS